MRSSALLVVAVTFCAPACATLTPEQQTAIKNVQVRSVSPEQNCQNLGVVSGSQTSDGPGGMRAATVKLGGNLLRVDGAGGTAFYCPDFAKPLPDADQPPPAE